jgi:glutamyl-Q tRNA(Asp) synthetase
MIVSRFAPSPTGGLHLGHAWSAIQAHDRATNEGGRFLLRIEDTDVTRSRPEHVAGIIADLEWLGLGWDEMSVQSERLALYDAALQQLRKAGLAYPCFCTRAEIATEIARAGEAQHGPDGPKYPGTCRILSPEEGAARIAGGESYALRLDVTKAAAATGPLTFREQGHIHDVDPFCFGDIVIARKDLPTSYHLAVVVDDAHQQVSLVTRGEDLLSATHIQRLLQALLKLPEPAYAHHSLVLDSEGRKFSKRDGAVSLQSLRDTGETPADIRARIGL